MPIIESSGNASTAQFRFHGDPKLWEEVARLETQDGRLMPKEPIQRLLASMPDGVVRIYDESGGAPTFEPDPKTKILLTYPLAQEKTPKVQEMLTRVFQWQSHFQRMGGVINAFGTRPSSMISTEGEAFVGVDENPR